VFKERALKIIFDSKRDEVTGGYRKLHNEELIDLYSSVDIVRPITMKENEMGGTCSTHWDMRSAWTILVGEYERKRPQGILDVEGRVE
jgi:hypothetical protein